MLLAFCTLLYFQSLQMARAQYSDQIQNVNFRSLKQLLNTHDTHSIANLLPLLPESFRSRYALMFKSRSLHESSYVAPRVILYGADAQFIVTFNGNPDQKGFEALETMEFDNEKKSFLFREIIFSESAKNKFKTTISEANPKKCTACHGEPSRPIWDTHPNWPGAYGERYRMPLGVEENVGFQNFLKIQPTHPRYKYLTEIGTFADQNALKHSAHQKYEGIEKPHPNSELNSLLNKLNYQWIMSELKKSPQFQSFKYAILASLDNECENIDSMLPENVKISFKKKLKDFSKEAELLNLQQENAKRKRLQAESTEARDSVPQKITNRFRYLVEEGLNLSTRRWSLAFENGSSDFTSAEMDIRDLEPYIKEEISNSDEKINQLYPSSLHADHFCSYLRKQSLIALKNFIEQKKSTETIYYSGKITPEPRLLATCIGCHESGVAPNIEFSKPNTLAQLLTTKKYPRGYLIDEILFRLSPEAGVSRMPLNQIISANEQEELVTYFQSLPKALNGQQIK